MSEFSRHNNVSKSDDILHLLVHLDVLSAVCLVFHSELIIHCVLLVTQPPLPSFVH